TIAILVVCKQYKSDIQFNHTSSRSLEFKIHVKCNCNETFINSSPFINKVFEINCRIVFIFRLLGVYSTYIYTVVLIIFIWQRIKSSVYKAILKSAVINEKMKNKEAGNIENHLTMSGDVVKSSFCQGCNLRNNKFQHSYSLNSNIWKIIKLIYENLSSELLERELLDTEMQNNNESLNTLIWNFTSKHLHCAAKMIEIATFLAVIIFNEGFVPILKIRDVMGVTIGKWKCTHSRNEARIR
ncbi:hypothetical protein ALC53_01418, partial [Atta colombica]